MNYRSPNTWPRLIIALTMIVFVLFLVTDAHATYEASMQDYAETCAGGTRADLMLDRMVEVGATMIRMNVNHMNEECQWRYTLMAARTRGLKVHLTLGSWTTKQAAKIINAVKSQVSYYSVWNEPNHPHTWNPEAPISSGSGKQYVNWFRKIYKVIHNRDRSKSTKVLFGEYAPDNGSHLRRTLKFIPRRRPIKAEGLAVHPYVMGNAQAFRKQILMWRRAARDATKRARICLPGRRCRALPVYITEFASLKPAISPARYWKAACKLRAPMMMQYQLRPTDQAWNTSILNADMSPTNRSESLRKYLEHSPCTN